MPTLSRLPASLLVSRLLALAAAGLGLGAAATALAAASSTVDVYVSVGQSKEGASCDPENAVNCEIWRVRMKLGGTTASTVERAVQRIKAGDAVFGVVQPALSPNGKRLAWKAVSSSSSSIYGMIVEEGKVHQLTPDAGEAKKARAEWPEWVTDSTLLYNAKTGEADGVQLKTVYSIDVASMGSPGAPVARFGNGVDKDNQGDQDAAVRRAGGEVEVVTFGPVNSGGETLYEPRVRALSGNGAPKTRDWRSFTLGKTEAGTAIKECHHPAWNPGGTEIMCMVQRPTEPVGGVATRLLYNYGYDSTKGTWSAKGRTFEPKEPKSWGVDSSRLFGSCNAINYKYAQWCGDEDWVIATVYCTGKATDDRGAPVNASRVMLVKRSTAQYVDVTGLVEKGRSMDTGELRGFTATCGVVE